MLQGTIKDFGLADILQLIGIQRKSGILTLENDSDQVAVKFIDGNVIGADTHQFSSEDLLGQVLVRTGKITEAQLQDALAIQSSTLQRLGHILIKSAVITEEQLADSLRAQALQIVYRLFRWREGNYSVQLVENLDYDERHFTPISAETILMEGARMIDEWPIIERKITSPQMVFQKTEAALKTGHSVEPIDQNVIDFDFGFDDDEVAEVAAITPKSDELSLSSDDLEILLLVDGVSTVEKLNDRTSLSDFDTYRVLADLLTRNLIAEVRVDVAEVATSQQSQVGQTASRWLLNLILAGAALISLVTLQSNPWSPWKVTGEDLTSEELRGYAAHAELERLEQAVKVFYLDTGGFPETLAALAESGYLDAADQVDPWGRSFGYEISSGGYQIYGVPPHGQPEDPELSISHRFTASQRMMMQGEP
jgi:hypothetical protein